MNIELEKTIQRLEEEVNRQAKVIQMYEEADREREEKKQKMQYTKNSKIVINGTKGRHYYKDFDLEIFGNHFDGSGITDFKIYPSHTNEDGQKSGHVVVEFMSCDIVDRRKYEYEDI